MVICDVLKHQEVTGLKFGVKYFGQPTLSTFIYYVDGLLIDTGQRRARKEILDETRDLRIEQILITHHHEDHSGNIHSLASRHDCPVYGSLQCCELMKDPPPISLVQNLTWGNRDSYADILPVNTEVKTRNHHFQVIPIPGHAPDMIALYEPNRRWLFSADLYINSYIGYFLRTESISQQIASIRKILELDFRVMFCSHNPKTANAKAQLSKKLDFLESSFEAVRILYEKGYSASQVFKQLKLRENWYIRGLSGGHLSKMNMVKAIIRDIEKTS